MKKLFLLCAFMLLTVSSANLFAANYIGSGFSTISFITSYNQFGPGDVAFRIATPISQCPNGYWFTKNDPGFQANLSMLIAAYQAKSKIRIYALPDQIWKGSSGTYCKLYSIEYH